MARTPTCRCRKRMVALASRYKLRAARALGRRRDRAACSGRIRTRASCGRTPASSLPTRARDAAQAQEPLVRPRVPQRPRRRPQGARGEWRALFAEFPTASWSAPTRSRPSAGTTSSSTRTGRARGSPTCRAPLAERIAWRNGDALFAFWKPRRPMNGIRVPRSLALRARLRAPARTRAAEALPGARTTRREAAATRSRTDRAQPGPGRQRTSPSTSPSARAQARGAAGRCASTPTCPSIGTG